MKTDVKNINSFTRQLKIEVPWDDLADKYAAFLRKFAKKINLPGYRRGKIPRDIVKKQFGPIADSEFAEEVVQEYYVKALDDGEYDAINQASISGLHFHEGAHLKFEATFEVEPEIKLPTYHRGMKFQNITFTRDEEDLTLALTDLRQHHAQLQTIETGAEEGQYLLANLVEVEEDGLPKVGGSKMDNQYLHLTNDGPFAGENMEKLKGVMAGEIRRIILPGTEGQDKHFEVTVNTISAQIVPDLDDEFAKMVEPGVETVEELRDVLGKRIQGSFDRESAKRFSRSVADYFVTKAKLDVPTSMIDTYIDNMIVDMREQGYPEEALNRDAVREEHKDTVIWNVKWYLLRRELMDQEEIDVTDDDVLQKIDTMVAEDSNSEKQIRQFYKRPEAKRSLKEDLRTDVLIEKLKGYAKVKEISKPSSELRKESKK